MLTPWSFGEVRLVLAGRIIMQVTLEEDSITGTSSTSRLTLYHAVQEEVTDLISSLLHLYARALPPPWQTTIFLGSNNSYTLTCHRESWAKMRERWEWRMGGEEVQGGEWKLRCVFGEGAAGVVVKEEEEGG